MFDLLIKNGRIIDGTGSPSYFADVAIKDGKIKKVKKGIKGDSKQILDAQGLVVTPGFIDSHAHNDSAIFTFPDQREKIEQGITTSIAGQCGSSHAPFGCNVPQEKIKMIDGVGREDEVYRTMGSFIRHAKDKPQGSNIAMLVGQCSLRRAVMGVENRKPTADELEKMKALLREGIEAGALGLSLGLIYTPGCYADTDECIELAKVAGEYNAVVAAHIRSEGVTLVRAVKEFITIIRASNGARGVLSHHKAAGLEESWGKVSHTIRMLREANEEGVEIYCDVYPYHASSTGINTSFLPQEFRAQSVSAQLEQLRDPQKRAEITEWARKKWQNDLHWVQLVKSSAYPQYLGMRMDDIARLEGKDPYDMIYDILIDSELAVTGVYFSIAEEDVETVLKYDRAMICTDGGVAGKASVYHPRLKASFPRAIGRYVREKGVVSLPEMIRKMTAMPAAVYDLRSKGLIWDGFDADLCIFDPDKLIDRSEFTDCQKRAEGLNYVLVAGEVVVENAVHNGKRNGKLILREE